MDHETRRLDELRDHELRDHETQRLDEPGLPNVCPKCGGERVLGDVSVTGGYYPLRFSITRELYGPSESRDRTAQTFCYALVCVHCGYTEFYTRSPRKLIGEP